VNKRSVRRARASGRGPFCAFGTGTCAGTETAARIRIRVREAFRFLRVFSVIRDSPAHLPRVIPEARTPTRERERENVAHVLPIIQDGPENHAVSQHSTPSVSRGSDPSRDDRIIDPSIASVSLASIIGARRDASGIASSRADPALRSRPFRYYNNPGCDVCRREMLNIITESVTVGRSLITCPEIKVTRLVHVISAASRSPRLPTNSRKR